MKSFTRLDGLVVPLDRPNVDTDAMVPKQFLKRVTRTGFGPNLFDESRYLDHGEPDMDCSTRPKNPDFVLNQERYQGAEILLTRENFGCGSSREHAPWALAEYGFGAILAPSFADIFYNNCFKNGLLAVVLPAAVIGTLFEQVAQTPGYRLDIDLERQQVRAPDGAAYGFEVDAFRKRCLLDGLDEIGLSMLQAQQVRAYEEKIRAVSPWLVS